MIKKVNQNSYSNIENTVITLYLIILAITKNFVRLLNNKSEITFKIITQNVVTGSKWTSYDKKKTTFSTGNGLHQLTVMAFGL